MAIQDLAPLHNPPATFLVRACQERAPHLPQVCVFDTAYHATIPECDRTYALPRSLADKLGIRKYGFHGTSHQFVVSEAAKMLGKPLNTLNAVSCHLGSGGASLCAVADLLIANEALYQLSYDPSQFTAKIIGQLPRNCKDSFRRKSYSQPKQP